MESIVDKILCARYRIIQKLSHDDFSQLYLAEDLKAKSITQCQIERLQPNYNSEVLGDRSWRKTLQEFDDRGNILKNISQHPQIPQLLAFFESDRQFYLVRELIVGENLAQQLEKGNLSEAQAVEWLEEILNVLEFVHQAGILHLNIQPTSLIQARDGNKFLTNFASIKNAIVFGEESTQTIADRQFYGRRKTGAKANFSSDIYALGKTTIYALTGRAAKFIQSESSLKANNITLDDGDTVAADIKPELADLLNKMIEENPARGYQSVAEVLAELNFESQGLVSFPPPLIPSTPPSFTAKKKSKSVRRSQKKSGIKMVWLLLTLPFIVALAIIFIGLKKDIYADFTDYSNNSYRFSLKYPEIWSLKDVDDPITGEVVSFTSPKENSADQFQEKLYISVEYLPGKSTTLEQYSQTVIERIEQNKNNNIEVYQERKTKIDDLPARMIVYSRQQGAFKLRQMEVFTIKNDRVYVAIYTAERAKYSKFLETAEKIIDSWSIE